MSNMKDRENAFENKFVNDQDVQFRVQSRAVKQFGFWAAERLNLTGDDAECYAQQVVDADFDEPGIGDVMRKVRTDFEAQKIAFDADEMNRIYLEKHEAAKHSIMNEDE